MARTPIEAPLAQPPRYGLLVAASVDIGDTGPRWQNGVTFESEQCGSSGRAQVECIGNTAALDTNTSPGLVTSDPFLVYASDRCSPFGYGARDFTGRARRQLEATQSFQVAEEFWTGSLRDAADTGDQIEDNVALVDVGSDTVTTGEASAVDALACLEQGLAECSQGRRGMIHATPQLATQWLAADAIRIEGGIMLSPMGNLIVADAGYDGSGPGGVAAGATQWAYATGMVSVRMSTPIVNPAELETAQQWAEALGRDDNTVDVFAERLALVLWDQCCHIAAEVDLPTCAIGGAS